MTILLQNQIFPNNKIILDFITLKDKMHKAGRQKRFFKILCFNTETKQLEDVTYEVYQLVKEHEQFSFKDNCFLEIGCGMDMAFNLSNKLSEFLGTEQDYFWCLPRKQKEKEEETEWCLDRIINFCK